MNKNIFIDLALSDEAQFKSYIENLLYAVHVTKS